MKEYFQQKILMAQNHLVNLEIIQKVVRHLLKKTILIHFVLCFLNYLLSVNNFCFLSILMQIVTFFLVLIRCYLYH